MGGTATVPGWGQSGVVGGGMTSGTWGCRSTASQIAPHRRRVSIVLVRYCQRTDMGRSSDGDMERLSGRMAGGDVSGDRRRPKPDTHAMHGGGWPRRTV